MEHRRGRSSPNATPLAILGFSFIHTFHSLGGHLSMILLTTRGKIRRNPTSSLPPIICHHHLKPNTAQLMERQSRATMHIPLHYTIQCIQTTDSKLAQLTVLKTASQEPPIKLQRYVQDLIIEPQKKFLNTEFLKNFLKAVPQMESYMYAFCCNFLFSPNKPKKTKIGLKTNKQTKRLPLLAIWPPQRECEKLNRKEVGVEEK